MAPTFAVTSPGGVGRLGRLNDELRQLGADVLPLGDVRIRRPQSIVKARSMLRGALAALRPDAVVCHAPWSYALFAPVARRMRLPLVCWQHDRATGRPLVERWAARTRADLVVCNSAWTSESAALLQPGVPTTVIHPRGRSHPARPGLVNASADARHASSRHRYPVPGRPNAGRDISISCALLAGCSDGCVDAWIAGAAQRPHEEQYWRDLRREVTRART